MENRIHIEWQAMSQANKDTVWRAYDWGAERDFREMGAIYAVENRGKMRGVRIEYNGDECAGPGQNNVKYAALRTFGPSFTRLQYIETKRRLQSDLDYSLKDSYVHIRRGLGKFEFRWEVWKYYNGQNAPHERYPARVQAWLKFLDNQKRSE